MSKLAYNFSVAEMFGSFIIQLTIKSQKQSALSLPQLLATSDNERYLYGHERIGIERDGVWSYPLPDALGSVRQRADVRGNVTGVAAYGPFGNLIQREGANDHFGFTGEMSGAFGLQYLRARWYDPGSGRFTQVDPFAGVAALPGTQHPYGYGFNNPLRYRDPSGRCPLVLALLGVAVLGGVIGGVSAYAINLSQHTRSNQCTKWWQGWNWGEALNCGLKGALLGGLVMLAAYGVAGIIQWVGTPLGGLVLTRLGLALFGGMAGGIGYAIPALILGTFDWRQLTVAIGVGALFGAFPDFLGGAGVAAILRGALANELQYIGSAVACDDVGSLASPEGHLLNIVVGGAVGKLTGPSLSQNFDDVLLRAAVPKVFEDISGRYTNQFFQNFVNQTLQQGARETIRSSIWEVINNGVTSDRLYQMSRDILRDVKEEWLKP